MNFLSDLPSRFPPQLILEVTTQCNYRCPFCYCFWHEFPDMVKGQLTTEEWKYLIETAVQRGVENLLFSGGEALMRSDIAELLEFTVRKAPQLQTGLFTNGSLMDEKIFLFCKERKITVSTSLQGLRSHSILTGSSSGYRKTLELIAFGRQEEWPVGVSITATQRNKDEICDIFAAAAVCGASSIQLEPMMPEGRGAFHPELLLSAEEWEAVKHEIRSMKDCGVPYNFCDEILCFCRSHTPEITKRFSALPKTPCEAGKLFGVIGPDGKYRKCLHSLPE